MAELMTLQEIAAYLRVTTKTMYRLLNQRTIPAIKVGHQWRFDRAAIDQWLRQDTAGAKIKILVIDDEELIRTLLKDTLEELGHTVVTADTGLMGLELAERQAFDLVFLDLKMPGVDGAEIFRQLKEANPKLPITIITGYPDSDIMAQALRQGPFGIINKPFGESDVIAAMTNFLGITKHG